ncbi:alginate export family protein [Sphingobium scionense]
MTRRRCSTIAPRSTGKASTFSFGVVMPRKRSGAARSRSWAISTCWNGTRPVPTRNRDLHNVSLRLMRAPASARLDYEVEGIWQMGTIRSSTAVAAPEQDVAAWFVHADVGYSWPGPLKPRLSVEFDYASGDRRGGSYGRFDTLFGMRRADFVPGDFRPDRSRQHPDPGPAGRNDAGQAAGPVCQLASDVAGVAHRCLCHHRRA